MPRSTLLRNTTRTLLLALTVQGFATACDLKSPVEPDNAMRAPDQASYGLTPSGVAASTVSWSQIDVSWARTPSATGYQLFRADGPTGSYAFLTSTAATVLSFSNTGLTGSTQYCYQVRAVKTAGKNTTYSAFSSAACATTSPPPVAAPSETDALPQGYALLVRWKDNSANEDGFRIERAPAPSGPWQHATSASANGTSAYSYIAAWDALACFRVIAFNSLGSSTPSTADCTAAPAIAGNLTATVDAPAIELTWPDVSAVEDGYRISRQDQNGAVVEVTLPANAVSYRDAEVTPDVTYTYRVQPLKDGGYSPYSNEAIGLVATSAPAAPSYASGYFYWDYEGYGYNYLTISWSDNSANEQGFRIEYSLDGSTGWAAYATSPANTGYYQLAFDAYYDPAPPPACYRIVAFNSAGASTPSNVACVEPQGAPTDLAATAVDQQAIDLAWTDNASIETGYVVIRSTTYDGVYERVATLSANATTYHDSGLASGQEYWYLVYATYPDDGWGASSNYAVATTTVAGAALKASGTRVLTRPPPTGAIRVKGVTPPKRVTPIRERAP